MIDWTRISKSQRIPYIPNYTGNTNKYNQNVNNSVSKNINVTPNTGSLHQSSGLDKANNHIDNAPPQTDKQDSKENNPKVMDHAGAINNQHNKNDDITGNTEDIINKDESISNGQQHRSKPVENTESLNSGQDEKNQADEIMHDENRDLSYASTCGQDSHKDNNISAPSFNEERKSKTDPPSKQDIEKASKPQDDPWFNPINDLLVMYIKSKKRK